MSWTTLGTERHSRGHGVPAVGRLMLALEARKHANRESGGPGREEGEDE
jgi:hypothetical protein